MAKRRLLTGISILTVAGGAALGVVAGPGGIGQASHRSDALAVRESELVWLLQRQAFVVPTTAPPGFFVANMLTGTQSALTQPGTHALAMFSAQGEPSVVICVGADRECDRAVAFGTIVRRSSVDAHRVTIGLLRPSPEDRESLAGLSPAGTAFWRSIALVGTPPAYLTAQGR